MLRRLLPAFVGLSLLFVALGASSAGASTGTLTVDVKNGTLTWSATVLCDAGDEVEIELVVTQGLSQASVESAFICPQEGQHFVFERSEIGDGQLHPGRAQLDVHRVDYVAGTDGQVLRVERSVSPVNLRPGTS